LAISWASIVKTEKGQHMKNIGFILFSIFFALSLSIATANAFQDVPPSKDNKPPVLENQTKSVEASIVKKREEYFLILTNLTEKNIITVRTFGSLKGISFGRTHGGKLDKMLLAPGESVRLEPFPELIFITPKSAGFDESAQAKITISQVYFDDLTFEGDKDDHLHAVGGWLGDKIQMRKIANLFQKALENPEPDAVKISEDLRQQLSALTEKPDQYESTPLEKRLAPLNEKDISDLRIYISWRMIYRKKEALSALKDREGRSIQIITLKSWLTYHISEYEKKVKDISTIL
jgi:hypothetical protein